MILGLDKKVSKIVLKIIDETVGKKFPVIDKLTDLFQENEVKFKKLESEIKDLKTNIKKLQSAVRDELKR